VLAVQQREKREVTSRTTTSTLLRIDRNNKVVTFELVFHSSCQLKSGKLYKSFNCQPIFHSIFVVPAKIHTASVEKSSSLLQHLLRRLPLLGPLAVSLGGVIALVDDKVLGPVVFAAAEVGIEDGLGAGGVTRLCVERSTRHVRDGGVAGGATPVLVGGGAEGVVLGCWLREPDVTAVAAELAGGEGLGDILLDDDGAAGGVDEPRAWEVG
jgi:hypothetical protein